MMALLLIEQLIDTIEPITNFAVFKSPLRKCKTLQIGCDYTKTIMHALKYYSLLKTESQDDFNNTLTTFCNKIYKSLVDDFIHVIQHHKYDLYYISNCMLKQFNLEC
eukprot:496789_1